MTVHIGIIGAGRAGLIHAKAFLHHVKQGELVALCDPNQQARAAARRELGVNVVATADELLATNIDAVVITTPTKHHHDAVLKAAAAGKHILCEKPMAITAQECRAMIAATHRAGVKLQIGFMRRFDLGHRRAKELIEQGAIGDIVSVTSLTHGPSVPHPWMYDLQASNGPLAEVSSHDIDALRWFTGAEITSVYAIAGNFRSAEAHDHSPDYYDTVLLTARFSNGTLGHINGAQGVRYGYDSRVEIHGTTGRIDIGDLNANRVVVSGAQGSSYRDTVPSWRTLYHDAYSAEDAAFVDAIIHDTEPLATGEDGLAAVEVVQAGNTSITTGKIQYLNTAR
ncbi:MULTISPECIES: Gfo/Idh/MocA family oxidoreductase [unclassified Actinobaculum]|uniref:Gfo/Idh/MocA family oxidoreductase n=1 Tax=unclassified Actinobaculum TaxID=2609299 RepID=UPI000D527664|nr:MULTISPECIES: Gfo/Idh/MocA family oxidoreductase [unclassified Actinobaculum]AWE41994.1 oxidoreductase [Actinobaculum sp. 313]RTE50090.1 oxidoreductase [Actinobaculum sp. 352]